MTEPDILTMNMKVVHKGLLAWDIERLNKNLKSKYRQACAFKNDKNQS